jgi:hypothetical protein
MQQSVFAGFPVFGGFPDLHLALIETLTDEQMDMLISLLDEIGFPAKPETRRRKELLGLIKDKIGLTDLKPMDELFGRLTVVLKYFDNYEDFSDFIEAATEKCEPESIRPRARRLLGIFGFKQYFYDLRLTGYAMKANTFCTDVYYACDLRGRFNQDYNYEETPAEKYDPKLIDVMPIATLMFELNDGSREQRAWFQVNADDLNEIIAKLLAAQKELKILSESGRGCGVETSRREE